MKAIPEQFITAEQCAELAALAALPDDEINIASIPEQRDWNGALRGVLYRRV